MEPLIDMTGITRHYRMGDQTVVALAGVDLADPGRRAGGHRGRLRLGQDDPDEPGGLPRHAHRRRTTGCAGSWCRAWTTTSCRGCATGRSGSCSRTSSCCRAPPPSRTSSCPWSTGACPRGRAPAAGQPHAGAGGPGPPDGPPQPRAVRAGSASGWPSPARWWPSRRCCWPTSRPATSTRPPSGRSWRLFADLHAAGHTIVLVTHELSLAALCPRVIRLDDGRVVSDGPPRSRQRRPHAGGRRREAGAARRRAWRAGLLAAGLRSRARRPAAAGGRPGALQVVRGALEDRFVLTGELEAVSSENLVVPRTPHWTALGALAGAPTAPR